MRNLLESKLRNSIQIMAERVGFEPTEPVKGSQHFQCCQFNHSCTFPKLKIFNRIRLILNSDVDAFSQIGRCFLVILSKKHRRCNWLIDMAERVGFEPTVPVKGTTIFETARFNHSRTSPEILFSRPQTLIPKEFAHKPAAFVFQNTGRNLDPVV